MIFAFVKFFSYYVKTLKFFSCYVKTLIMVTVSGNALIGPELKHMKDVRIQISDEGTIVDISKEEKPSDYELPSSYLLIPGFINAHTHVGDAFLKDQTYGLSLEESVGNVGVKNKKFESSTLEEKNASIKNSLDMLVQNGYTTFLDFREEGLEGVNLLKNELTNYPIRGLILGRSSNAEQITNIMKEGDGFGFVDVFSISQEMINEAKTIKDNYPEKLIAIHVSESMEMVSRSSSAFGKREIEMICDYSSFDYVIHANYANENDLSLLKKHDINVVCCPISNLYYGLKFPPIESIQEKEILLGLGTDNVLSCNPDPFRLMAMTLYVARINNQKLNPKEILKAVTVNPGLISQRKIGQLEVGYSGDLIGVNLENPNLKFSKDIYTALTMRADPSDIVFQMFKGKVVKWAGLK